MPDVIDNIALRLVDSLRDMLAVSYGADFCVGYFHLRGYKVSDTAWHRGRREIVRPGPHLDDRLKYERGADIDYTE